MKAENHKQTKCLNKLKNLLARRAHSEKELKRKLNTFSKTEVEQAIETAKKNKWLEPPEEMALRWKAELDRKKKGWLYIQSALKKRGLPTPPKSEEKEREKALWHIEKRFHSLPPTQQTKEKIKRFLTYRGFEQAVIQKALMGGRRV